MDGKIVVLGSVFVGFNVDKMIDVLGLVVVFGFVDLCVWLCEFGYEYKVMFVFEMVVVVVGGVMIFVCLLDIDFVFDELGFVEMFKFCVCNFY